MFKYRLLCWMPKRHNVKLKFLLSATRWFYYMIQLFWFNTSVNPYLKFNLCNTFFFIVRQMKLYNRNFAAGERIEYMGWVNEGILNTNQPWQSYRPRFLALKGTDVLLFDSPPVSEIFTFNFIQYLYLISVLWLF